MDEDEELSPIVIDNGSYSLKAGFGGADAPSVICKPVVGTPKYKGIIECGYCRQMNDGNLDSTVMPSDVINIITKYHLKDLYCGNETKTNSFMLHIIHSIEHGVITSWDNIELLWRHVFKQLRVQPEEHCILLTEQPFNEKKNKQKMAEIVFESFNAPSMQTINAQVSALFAMGRTTGIVLDIGHDITWSVPIYEGYIQHYNALLSSSQITGKAITKYLMKLLQQKGHPLQAKSVTDIKEKLCYVSADFKKEIEICDENSTGMEREYVLPDGTNISLGSERFQCCEALFQPRLIQSEWLGVHQLLYDAIQLTEIEEKRDYYTNVVLSGGSTMFQGLDMRLKKELQRLAPASIRVQIANPISGRKLATWTGGSIISSISTFQDRWITKREYDKYGSGIIHRKLGVF
eukprot:221129_1